MSSVDAVCLLPSRLLRF